MSPMYGSLIKRTPKRGPNLGNYPHETSLERFLVRRRHIGQREQGRFTQTHTHNV